MNLIPQFSQNKEIYLGTMNAQQQMAGPIRITLQRVYMFDQQL